MKKLVVSASMLVLLFAASTAVSQEHVEQCNDKKSNVEKLQQDKVAINAEIDQIKKTLEELKLQRLELQKSRTERKRAVVKKNQEINAAKRVAKQACLLVERCEKAKVSFITLKTNIGKHRKVLKELRAEIKKHKADADALASEIAKLEKQYNDLGCRELVAGETEQSTIDTCNNIFSRWNAMQKELNALNTATRDLRNRYRRVMGKMQRLRNELKFLGKRIRTNCKVGQEVDEVGTLEEEQKDFDAIDGEIKAIDTEVKKIRKIKIIKPKIKKAKKSKKKFSISGKVKVSGSVKGETKGKTKVKTKVKTKGKTKTESKSSVKAKGSASGKASGKATIKIK